MILFGNIVYAMAKLVELAGVLLTFYKYILIAAAIVSWVNADPYNQVVVFLRRVTEPVLSRIRSLMPPLGPVDLSPMVAFALIYILQIVVIDTLYQYLVHYSMILKLR